MVRVQAKARKQMGAEVNNNLLVIAMTSSTKRYEHCIELYTNSGEIEVHNRCSACNFNKIEDFEGIMHDTIKYITVFGGF